MQVNDLQQLLIKVRPMSSKELKLKFARASLYFCPHQNTNTVQTFLLTTLIQGIDRTVILGMVDQMLANKDVNIWWLPDDIERLLYVNVITLMLQIMDEVVDVSGV